MTGKYPPELVDKMVEALDDVAISTGCMTGENKDICRINGCVLDEVRDVLVKIAEFNK